MMTDSLICCSLLSSGAPRVTGTVGFAQRVRCDRVSIGSAKRPGTRYDGKSPEGNHQSSS